MSLHAAWRVALAGAAALSASAVRADESGFALDRYVPSEAGSRWFTLDSLDFHGHVRPAASLVGDYAHRPLSIYGPDGSLRGSVVAEQVMAHFGGSLVLVDRARLGLSVPLVLVEQGSGASVNGALYPAPQSALVGDVRLGIDTRLYGESGDPLTVAAGVQAFIPSGNRSGYLGDESLRFVARVMAAGDWGMITWAGQLGFHYRELSQPVGDAVVGSEFLLGLAVGMRFFDKRLLVGPELYGGTVVSNPSVPFSEASSPLEILLGAHYRLPADLTVGAGGGFGITRGCGSPQARVLVSFSWQPAVDAPPPPPSSPPSRKRDLLVDSDGDGIPDDDDACPDVAGVRSTHPKDNGCPKDRDGDGIADTEDSCPDQAGPRSFDSAKNGCPTGAARPIRRPPDRRRKVGPRQ